MQALTLTLPALANVVICALLFTVNVAQAEDTSANTPKIYTFECTKHYSEGVNLPRDRFTSKAAPDLDIMRFTCEVPGRVLKIGLVVCMLPDQHCPNVHWVSGDDTFEGNIAYPTVEHNANPFTIRATIFYAK